MIIIKKKVMSYVVSSMIFASLVSSTTVNAEETVEEPPADLTSDNSEKNCIVEIEGA